MANTRISALPAASTPLAGTELVPIVQGGITEQVSVANLTAGRAVSASALTASSGGVSVKGGPTGYGGDEIAMTTTTSTYCAISTQMTGGTFYFDNRGTGNNVNWTWRNGTGASTTRMVLGATGDLTVSTGNVIVGTSGKGIDFSATAGTGTSELFADYEEGVFTATLTCTSGTITLNGSQDQMQYTKIGRVVYISGQIGVSSISSPSGSLKLAGLPFTTSNSLGELAGRGSGTVVADTVAITINNTVLTFLANSTVMTIEKYAAGVQANMAADVSAGSSFWISAWYVAA
jgi:hypothetical protein